MFWRCVTPQSSSDPCDPWAKVGHYGAEGSHRGPSVFARNRGIFLRRQQKRWIYDDLQGGAPKRYVYWFINPMNTSSIYHL